MPKERRLLALLIANEWENQDEVLKQHALPVVRLSSPSPCPLDRFEGVVISTLSADVACLASYRWDEAERDSRRSH